MSYVALQRFIWLAIVGLPLLVLGAISHSLWAWLWIVPGVFLRISLPVGTFERRLIARFGERSDSEIRSYAVEVALEGGMASMQPIEPRLSKAYPELPSARLVELDAYARTLKSKAAAEMAACVAGRGRRDPIAARFRDDHPELHRGTVWSLLAYGQLAAAR
jgi:hypothetical protein